MSDGFHTAEACARVIHTSFDVLEHILSHEQCDVDPINRIDKTTPLHLAVVIEDPKVRADFVESLLDAGADFTFVRPVSVSRPPP